MIKIFQKQLLPAFIFGYAALFSFHTLVASPSNFKEKISSFKQHLTEEESLLFKPIINYLDLFDSIREKVIHQNQMEITPALRKFILNFTMSFYKIELHLDAIIQYSQKSKNRHTHLEKLIEETQFLGIFLKNHLSKTGLVPKDLYRPSRFFPIPIPMPSSNGIANLIKAATFTSIVCAGAKAFKHFLIKNETKELTALEAKVKQHSSRIKSGMKKLEDNLNSTNYTSLVTDIDKMMRTLEGDISTAQSGMRTALADCFKKSQNEIITQNVQTVLQEQNNTVSSFLSKVEVLKEGFKELLSDIPYKYQKRLGSSSSMPFYDKKKKQVKGGVYAHQEKALASITTYKQEVELLEKIIATLGNTILTIKQTHPSVDTTSLNAAVTQLEKLLKEGVEGINIILKETPLN